MQPKAGYYTPILHVDSIEASIRYYGLLGFELIHTDGCRPIGWARMHCAGGAVMFLRAEEPHEKREHSVLFYLYTPDLPALRAYLVEQGLEVSEVKRPPYMPSGEVHLRDPDGHPIFIAHWSDKEHQDWLLEIGKKE